MAKELFKTPLALMQGYCDLSREYHLDNLLTKESGGRKVYLLGRQLKNGNISLYRYKCHNGKRIRESVGEILYIEVNAIVKRENEKKLENQVQACNRLNAELTEKNANFTPSGKSKVRLLDFIDILAEEWLRESGNRHSMYAVMESLAKHIRAFTDEDVTFKEIDKDWCLRFIDYLKHDALNFNYLRTEHDERKKEVRISQNTQHRLIVSLNRVFKKAVKRGLIALNPMAELEHDDKVSAKKGTREYLTDEEVKKLMRTPYTHGHYNIKEAFLFSCYTGLRYSDLQQLKMSDFRLDKTGRYIKIQMVKTHEPLKIYIPDVAFRLIPEMEDDEAPVFRLPKNDYANETLRKWIKDAGIKNKYVSFHVGRHSAATILYSAGLPLQVIQKQLGHLKASTTEIYAKLVDDAQKDAANTMDSKFSGI